MLSCNSVRRLRFIERVRIGSIPTDGSVAAGERNIRETGAGDARRQAGQPRFDRIIAARRIAGQRNEQPAQTDGELIDHRGCNRVRIVYLAERCVLDHASSVGIGNRNRRRRDRSQTADDGIRVLAVTIECEQTMLVGNIEVHFVGGAVVVDLIRQRRQIVVGDVSIGRIRQVGLERLRHFGNERRVDDVALERLPGIGSGRAERGCKSPAEKRRNRPCARLSWGLSGIREASPTRIDSHHSCRRRTACSS